MRSHIYLIIVIVFTFSNVTFGATKYLPGIKVGMNYNRLSLNETVENIVYTASYPKYHYPGGVDAGFFIESSLVSDISIVVETIFSKNISKLTIYTADEWLCDQQVSVYYLNVPILLKVTPYYTYIPSFSIGINNGILLKAKYELLDINYDIQYVESNIKENLSNLYLSLKLGIGKRVRLSNKIYLLCEVAGQLGLMHDSYERIGEWRNTSLHFSLGIQYDYCFHK